MVNDCLVYLWPSFGSWCHHKTTQLRSCCWSFGKLYQKQRPTENYFRKWFLFAMHTERLVFFSFTNIEWKILILIEFIRICNTQMNSFADPLCDSYANWKSQSYWNHWCQSFAIVWTIVMHMFVVMRFLRFSPFTRTLNGLYPMARNSLPIS